MAVSSMVPKIASIAQNETLNQTYSAAKGALYFCSSGIYTPGDSIKCGATTIDIGRIDNFTQLTIGINGTFSQIVIPSLQKIGQFWIGVVGSLPENVTTISSAGIKGSVILTRVNMTILEQVNQTAPSISNSTDLSHVAYASMADPTSPIWGIVLAGAIGFSVLSNKELRSEVSELFRKSGSRIKNALSGLARN